jgi:hypothetical protein
MTEFLEPDSILSKLVSAGVDGTIRFWDTLSRKQFVELTGLGPISDIKISPDGDWLAAAGEKGMYLWKINPKRLSLDKDLDTSMNQTCGWLWDYLTNSPEVEEQDRDLCRSSIKVLKAEELAKKQASQAEELVKEKLQEVYELAKKGDIRTAIATLQQIQKLAPSFQIAAEYWNALCWNGSLSGYAEADVIKFCEKAVALKPDEGEYKDSRGIARALAGDTALAIQDFEAFLKWIDTSNYSDANKTVRKERRQRWIEALKAGKPASTIFTKELLEQLQNE